MGQQRRLAWGRVDRMRWKASGGSHRRSVLAPAGLVIRDVGLVGNVPEDMRREVREKCERSAREVREEGGSERRSEATFVHSSSLLLLRCVAFIYMTCRILLCKGRISGREWVWARENDGLRHCAC